MTELLAPNGKPSNLSPEQYKLVRTTEFKKWFGDWENSPETASKVVDSNGEPLIMYHGTQFGNFTEFERAKIGTNYQEQPFGFYFTNIKSPKQLKGYSAEEYANKIGTGNNPYVFEVFLNIENPIIQEVYSERPAESIDWEHNELRNKIKKNLLPAFKGQEKKIDGVIAKSQWQNTEEVIAVALKPNQIKLADGTNTNFDGNNPDIRFEEGGTIDLKQKQLEIIHRTNPAPNEYNLWIRKVEDIKTAEQVFSEVYEGESMSPDFTTEDMTEALNSGYVTVFSSYPIKEGVFVTPSKMNASIYAGGKNGKIFSKRVKLTDIAWIDESEGQYAPTDFFEKGGRTIAQTPAPKKDQIKGSDKNKKGSSKDLKSAKKIELSDKTIEAIKNKVDKHNEKHPNKKITIDSAKAVVRRGMGAYSSSHRPTITGGNPNSRVAWGLARLNAFLYKIVNGKSKSGKYSQDNDLIEELGYKVEKYADGGIIIKPIENELAFNYLKRNNGFAQFTAKNGKLFYIVIHKGYAPLVQVFDGEKLNNALSKGYGINAIARAVFNVNLDNNTFSGYSENQSISVDDEYRRIGIATAITDFAEENLGMKYVPSKLLTQEMQGFVNNRFKHQKGGEIKGIMKNEIIDILSKNKRYGEGIFSIQEIGLDIIQKCIETNTYFGKAIKQAYENYIMIPISYEDKLFAIDKKVEYGYFSKPNENTNLNIEYKYDLKEYPFPVLVDSELIDNKDFNDINEYEEIKSNEFDSEYLYRGINSEEMKSIIENGFIKSNASLNIGEQQAETTSYAQYISQAGSYAVGFNAWYDEVTFPKPKYILKVKKEGVNFKPTNEGDIHGEVDVFGEVPIEKIDSIYEIRLGQCSMGTVEINVDYKGQYSEGSRFPMNKKVFVRKTDINTLIKNYNNQNDNAMTNSNPKDTITMDIPLLIRFAELMREDIKTDVALHEVVENLIEIKDKGILTMDDYESIVGNVTSTEESKIEEPKMEEGGKVPSIHSQKGDIKISLDDNWYSDDSNVELVPVSELIKFREFDRKINPKYNQDNSRDNINHLKFMFQKEGVKSPIIIEYSYEDNVVLIIEGNHRLNSAIDLGMEYLPARVVLRKYGKYSPAKIKNAMQVIGVKPNEHNYIPSDLKPSQVGIEGAKPIVYGDGGIIEGRLHSECGEDGCGRKFQVGENGHIIEAERDEAVIVADAFDNDKEMTIEGTPSEIASALNVIGGGKNFDKGAKIIENGQEKELPQMKQEAIDTDVDDVIDSGSIIINRRSMADEKTYEVTGTPKQIASAINSIDGNGVVIEKGAEIKES